MSILHERTKHPSVDPSGRGVPRTTIRSVLAEERRLTDFRVADALLTATGQALALYDGSITVVPNPRGAPEARSSCCNGSEGAVALLGVVSPHHH